MLRELRSQTTNLDKSKYKVMLLWDPDNARDVGWLTVEKDVKVDLTALQVRDVNLEKAIYSLEEANNEVKDTIIAQFSSSRGIQEANEDNEDATKNSLIDAKDIKPWLSVTPNHMESNKVKCMECKATFGREYFPEHMARIHGQVVSKYKKTRCDVCGKYINEDTLHIHKKDKHGVGKDSKPSPGIGNSELKKCGNCEKVFKNKCGLSMHMKACMKSGKNTLQESGGSIRHEKVDVKYSVEGEVKVSSTISPGPEMYEGERVSFNIFYEGRSYSCSRSNGGAIRSSLKKFCKHVGKDLQFEFCGRFLTGEENVGSVSGALIIASSRI